MALSNVFDFVEEVSFKKIFVLWVLIIIVFGVIYFLFSFTPENSLDYRGIVVRPDTEGLINSMYFSFVTSTSLGYGDISPLGMAKLFSIIEVISGLIMFGILISKLVSFKQESLLEEIYGISYKGQIHQLVSKLHLFRVETWKTMRVIEEGSPKREIMERVESNLNSISSAFSGVHEVFFPRRELPYNVKLDSDMLDWLLNSIIVAFDTLDDLIKLLDEEKKIDWKTKQNISDVNKSLRAVEKFCSRAEVRWKKTRAGEDSIFDKLENIKELIEKIKLSLEKPEKKSKKSK